MSESIRISLILTAACIGPASADSDVTEPRGEAAEAMRRAAKFYSEKVSSRGGYVYYYSLDLRQRWGEGQADAHTIYVQPPGTPTVGQAYLKAFTATGERLYLDAARDAAKALAHGQLESGGWTQTIHFAKPEKGRLGKYRNGEGGSWNVSSLDDGQTQSALEFLIEMDVALTFKDREIHEAAKYGLASLLKAQYPNGAFPQAWLAPAMKHPVVKAKYPEFDWRTQGKVKDYWTAYTLNDNLAGSVSDTLIAAHRAYKTNESLEAIERLGDFLILAQMPDPQPGWCQQYNTDMEPIWARKFEPPAITGWESQDVMRTLIKIARYTGKKKYLEPIPKALAYFEKRVLPDGKIARYIEFKTDKPLYMDQRYQLTYDDSAAPSHYGWKQPARFEEIAKDYQSAKDGLAAPAKTLNVGEEIARGIIRDLDAEGRWVSTYEGERLVGQPKFDKGFRYLSSEVFSRNVVTLSAYLSNRKK